MSQENVEVLGASGADRGRLIDDAVRAASHWAQRTVLCPNPRISARIGRYRRWVPWYPRSARGADLRPTLALHRSCLTSRSSPVRAGHRPSPRSRFRSGISPAVTPSGCHQDATWTRHGSAQTCQARRDGMQNGASLGVPASRPSTCRRAATTVLRADTRRPACPSERVRIVRNTRWRTDAVLRSS